MISKQRKSEKEAASEKAKRDFMAMAGLLPEDTADCVCATIPESMTTVVASVSLPKKPKKPKSSRKVTQSKIDNTVNVAEELGNVLENSEENNGHLNIKLPPKVGGFHTIKGGTICKHKTHCKYMYFLDHALQVINTKPAGHTAVLIFGWSPELILWICSFLPEEERIMNRPLIDKIVAIGNGRNDKSYFVSKYIEEKIRSLRLSITSISVVEETRLIEFISNPKTRGTRGPELDILAARVKNRWGKEAQIQVDNHIESPKISLIIKREGPSEKDMECLKQIQEGSFQRTPETAS